MNMVRLVLVLTLVVGAAVAANVALLSLSGGRHEPVGRLTPIADAGPVVSGPTTQPTVTTTPGTTEHPADHEDD